MIQTSFNKEFFNHFCKDIFGDDFGQKHDHMLHKTGLLTEAQFCEAYDRGQKHHAPQVRPDRGSNS